MAPLPRPRAASVLRYFTTDRATRVGVLQAAWSVAPSYARGLLPREPVQQAVATGVVSTSNYALGASGWSAIASIAAGVPGRRPGPRALLAASAITAVGGKAAELALRGQAEKHVGIAAAWAGARSLSVTGLAGGLTTITDLVLHDGLRIPRSPATTLLTDSALGAGMAGGTVLRRIIRQRKFGNTEPSRKAVAGGLGKTLPVVAGIGAGTAIGIGALAVSEQAVARTVTKGLRLAVGDEVGEIGDAAGHAVTFLGIASASYFTLQQVRRRMESGGAVEEPGYLEAPTSPYVSCGPRSAVQFDSIGREGRRFVLMALTAADIEQVMAEPAKDPVRAVIGREGAIEERARLAVQELEQLGGFERGLICVASPTGVGYVNYMMAEALEYLTRGDCAIVVPQYALVPSALALDQTNDGTRLQRAVLALIRDRILTMPEAERPRLVQFGESLGAQVALDVPGDGTIDALDALHVESGLYLGVPFRSRVWKRWRNNPAEVDPNGEMLLVSSSGQISPAPGRHVLVIHDDDPVNKFGYAMVVQPPWWMGQPDTRPPKVPRETLFRPITTFVLTVVDLFNGMNSRVGGQLQRVGHDYRIDLRGALAGAYNLPHDVEQLERIEQTLRANEIKWAETRLVARIGEKALANMRSKLNQWGQGSVDLDMMESPEPGNALAEYINQRLRSGSPDSE